MFFNKNSSRGMRRGLATVSALALGLTLAACSTDDADDTNTGGDGGSSAQAEDKNVRIAIHNGWDEGIAVSYLFKNILESEGYTVETDNLDPGVVYTSLSAGDHDVNFDMWLPITHEDYLEKFGDDLEQLGVWYDQAKLTIVVNEDSPAQSLADLNDHADVYGSRIVGIEAGAGLTRLTQDEAIPTYGLEDWDFVISSTPAMLAELKGATDAGDDLVATLWRPHWAYDEFPVRDLEDPENAMGDAEEIHTVGRLGFGEDFPEVADWIEAFELNDDQLFSLENIMFNENEGNKNEESVEEWLEANPDFVDELKASAN